MSNYNSHTELNELIDQLRSPETRMKTIEYLKSNEFSDDAINGLKSFLETKDYEVHYLNEYLNKQDALFNRIEAKARQNSKARYSGLKVAASIAIILGVSLWLYRSGNETEFYSEFAINEPGLPVYMDKNSDRLDNFMLEFKANKHQNVINLGNQLITLDYKQDTVRYFMGISYCRKGDFSSAIEHFQDTREVDSTLGVKRDFYWSLALLEIGKEQAAIGKLKAVAQTNVSQYNAQAKAVLKKLQE